MSKIDEVMDRIAKGGSYQQEVLSLMCDILSALSNGITYNQLDLKSIDIRKQPVNKVGRPKKNW